MPTELLVGPPIPCGGTPTPRYTRAMFSEPRPTLVKASALDFYPVATSNRDSEPHHRFEDWRESVQQPLQATGQKPGKRMDFFIQGLITGSAIVSFTLLLGFGMFVSVGYKKLRVEVSG